MRGFIQAAKPSSSGKTLGVQIAGTWYSTKAFELQQHVGKEIVGETSDSDYKGQTIHWLNSYTLVDGNAPKPPEEPEVRSNGQSYSHYQTLVSNLAAHLIAAGKGTDELGPWFKACRVLLEDEVPF